MNLRAPIYALSLLAFAACDGPSVLFAVDVTGIVHATGTVVVKRNGETLLTCHDHCTAEVPKGAALEITATPDDATARFTGFSAPCGADATCTTAWSAAASMTATFRPSGNFAFVTAKTIGMPLGDSAAASHTAADAFCQAQADAVKLPGHYVAWLSTHDRTAPSKLAGSSGWIRTDGKPHAGTPEKLAHGEIYYTLLDENAQVVYLDSAATPGPNISTYFTGTHVDGVASDDNCTDYTANTGAVTVGVPMNGALWTDFNFGGPDVPTCADKLSLACFEVGANADVTPHDTGRNAFVTDGTIAVPLAAGRASADALCASEATAAGLPGEYLALLSTSAPTNGAALSRFDTSDGTPPWVRVDGVRLVDKPSDMSARALLAPVGVTPTKSYVDQIFWTGSKDPLSPAAATDSESCADWTDPTLNAIMGSSDRSDLWYAQYLGDLCSVPRRLLCLQK